MLRWVLGLARGLRRTPLNPLTTAIIDSKPEGYDRYHSSNQYGR